jgi:putative ABC transport system permease protein
MIKLNIIFRNILRQKLNSGIIVISLAIGMACINLIAVFISRELNTDSFHISKNRIYALKCDDPWIEGAKMYHCRYGSAEYMQANFAQVEDLCRVNNAAVQKIIVNNESWFERTKIIAASKNFFEFFTYNLLTNNPKTALTGGNDLVISEDLAKKYFGSADAVGQFITLVNRDSEEQMVITGVFRKPVQNSQISFDMVRLIKEQDSRCYLRLTGEADPEELEILFETNKTTIPVIHGGIPGQYYLEPFRNAYFDTTRGSSIEASRDKRDLWIALTIGLMIIGIASFNYLGLINNILLGKTREYTVRKINGGSKFSIIITFMVENLIIISISFVLSLFLMLWAIPFFNLLTAANITPGFIFQTKQLLIIFAIAGLLLLITFFFASYRIRSKVNIRVIKPAVQPAGKHFQLPAFNIFQLSSSIVLIICSLIIIKQIRYVTNKQIGLNKQVIEVKIPGSHQSQTSVFREELMKNASIDNVSLTTASPVLEHFLILLDYEKDGVEKQYSPAGFTGDENYLSTLGIELIEGENFTGNPLSDKDKCLINESLARLFPDQNLIGKELPGMDNKFVAGIVKDFHYSSLKSFVEPGFISFDSNGSHLMVKAAENQITQAKYAITNIWEQLIPDYPVSMETIGERFEWFHRENRNYLWLIGSCCFISLFLSMIGLFAVSFQSCRSRTKEIGIRKVNGARVTEIITLLNKDFIAWVAIALVAATPASWYAMKRWLESYAYKIELSWWIFGLAGALALVIALMTVSWQSLKAATRNPVEALRYE